MNKNNLNLNALRMLGIQAVNKANSGHPGIILGAAPMVYSLFTKQMIINPNNPEWFNRDRFVLSAGHGSGLLYSALHLAGYNITIEDLKNFRQLNSKTPGHPEFGHTPGVDTTTGPLGQGFATAVGMALAESHLASIYNKPNFELINHYTYVICGDGDLQEGVCQESISFAGRYKLNKLIVLHDSNDIQLDAPVSVAQSENMIERFKAANWNTFKIENGEDLDSINKILEQAKKSDKPVYIEVKTIIGIGATNQGTQKVHGAPLGNDINTVKKYFNWEEQDFSVPQSVYDFWKQNCLEKGNKINHQWNELFKEYQKQFPKLSQQLIDSINQDWKVNKDDLKSLIKNESQATRVSSGNTLNYLTKTIPAMIGGSADLSESTKVKGPDGEYDFNNKSGRNIMYGVREFAMGAINNGIALHKGLLPFGSCFFVFSDYLKPAIRLSSLMKLQNIFIFTHDSVAVGEDGPTHQPIEQLAMLRSIPNISVYRPCDMNETVASYYNALMDKTNPSIIIATRQNLEELNHNDSIFENVNRGAYILEKDSDNPDLTLIASGSEVSLAIKVKQEIKLKQNNFNINIVSMVNMNKFDKQDKQYQQQILKPNFGIRISLELGSTFGWHKYLGDQGKAIGIESFGYSAPFNDILEHLNFTSSKISKNILEHINNYK